MDDNEKNELIALLHDNVFQSGDIPGVNIPPKSPNDPLYLFRFGQELRRDERLRPLFKILGNNHAVVGFYLIEMGEYFRQKAEKATQLHTDCFS